MDSELAVRRADPREIGQVTEDLPMLDVPHGPACLTVHHDQLIGAMRHRHELVDRRLPLRCLRGFRPEIGGVL